MSVLIRYNISRQVDLLNESMNFVINTLDTKEAILDLFNKGHKQQFFYLSTYFKDANSHHVSKNINRKTQS